MDLRSYWEILVRRRWVIVVTLAATLSATLLGTLLMTPRYRAAATLQVATATTGSADWTDYDLDYADRLMNTYLTLATTRPMLQDVARRLELTEPLEAVADRLELEILANTELIRIRALDPDPERAAALANTLAELLIARSGGRSDEVRAPRPEVTLVEAAVPPALPASPNRTLNLALGLLVGIVGGLGLAFLSENLDPTFYTEAQLVEATQLPVLAYLPHGNPSRVVAGGAPPPVVLADASVLRAQLVAHLRGRAAPVPAESCKTLLVVSSESGTGVSATVIQVALALAQADETVVAVDADFAEPVLHTRFGRPRAPGLSDLLASGGRVAEALQPTLHPNLELLSSGAPTDPPPPLGSKRMSQVLGELAGRCDWVVLGAPALAVAADALELAPKVGGVLLVAQLHRSQPGAVGAARHKIEAVGGSVVGTVVVR